MTITSGLARSSRHSTAVVATRVEPPEPVIEHVGLDGPETAHGGQPRRMPGPPVPAGLVTRVRPANDLPTMVRRIELDARGGWSAR
mgnify:FL=1